MSEVSAEELRRQAALLLAAAERIDARPEDEFELGTIITWKRTFADGGIAYSYAAIKFAYGYHAQGEERWALTGRSSVFLSWASLWGKYLSHADEGSVFWASELTPIEAP